MPTPSVAITRDDNWQYNTIVDAPYVTNESEACLMTMNIIVRRWVSNSKWISCWRLEYARSSCRQNAIFFETPERRRAGYDVIELLSVTSESQLSQYAGLVRRTNMTQQGPDTRLMDRWRDEWRAHTRPLVHALGHVVCVWSLYNFLSIRVFQLHAAIFFSSSTGKNLSSWQRYLTTLQLVR